LFIRSNNKMLHVKIKHVLRSQLLRTLCVISICDKYNYILCDIGGFFMVKLNK